MKNGRITICTAGYSHKHGFIRIYPTKMNMSLRRWNIVKVPLERNPQDSRKESWKIEGSKSEWDTLNEKVEILGTLPRENHLSLIANLEDGCITELNEAKRSLGIIKPVIEECSLSEQDEYEGTIQMTLSGRPQPKIREQYKMVPRVRYRCAHCKASGSHDQQVLEWGFYEWFRKNPGKEKQVWENAQIFSESHEIYFFVGSIFRHWSSFSIISVLRLPKGPVAKPLSPLKKF